MLEEMPYEEADSIVRNLLETAAEASKRINPKDYVSVPECKYWPTIAAVDGGSAILYDMGSMVVGAIRSGYLIYGGGEGGGKIVHEHVSPLQLVAVDRFNSAEMYEKACVEMDVPLHEHPLELDAFVQRLRYLKEMRGALDALDHLSEGDVLLLDGALRSDIPRPADVLAAVIDQAEARGITVVGVSKSSSLHIEGIPILALAKRQADGMGLGTWLYPVDVGDRHEYGKVSIGKLHPCASHAFRLDVAGDLSAIGALIRHSRDPSLIGYPSPLAVIHNRVAIPRSTAESMAMVMETRMSTSGKGGEWGCLLTDFHSMLDRGV